MHVDNAEFIAAETTARVKTLRQLGRRLRARLMFWYRQPRYAPAVGAICFWCIADSPAQFDADTGLMGVGALLVSRTIWLGTGVAAILGTSRASGAFFLLCAASVVAVAPMLPTELEYSSVRFLLSTVDCALKAAFVALVTAKYLANTKYAKD
ncbi:MULTISPECIES: hypothetical protein [unclassified Paraburkholderia]|uniref:hypothetical protein n=1 Tax=unclassified Paraburkholderia TaxID=2615204 RepID=UPI00160BEE53|nr:MULTISPECIES: hypothetical protein [unclassified Paraburkholderia]MBB5447795.1 hypothetical protein [Paraburkholderia sp. WSM4177]MBB5488268.1 hypothetical protein [Paraburkholderia sp. WSM4180]